MSTLREVLMTMSHTVRVQIVADSTVAGQSVPLPAQPTTAQNVETQIATLVKSLPTGTVCYRLYLPEPAGKRAFDGDDLAAYAQAQAKLLGAATLAPTTDSDEIEILGQPLPAERARGPISTLNLKQVYVLTNPAARSLPSGFGLATDPARWASLTPEQQKQQTDAVAQQLANMDPKARQQLMQQQFQIFARMMSLLPPDQRQMTFIAPSGDAVPDVKVIVPPGKGGGQ
jgi:hypothetical protein